MGRVETNASQNNMHRDDEIYLSEKKNPVKEQECAMVECDRKDDRHNDQRR